MELGDYISQYRKEAGLTIDELASLSGVPKGTINKIIAGTTKSPTLETVRSIATALGKSINDFMESSNKDGLSSSERAHIQKYRLLDTYGQEAVDGVLDVEWRRCQAYQDTKTEATVNHSEPELVYFIVPGFLLPMSAGTGEPADSEYPENYRLIKEPPKGTSFIARVHGRSMEPTYFDQQLVFVHATKDIPVGKVGVFWMDGQEWIKERGDGVLISHNHDPEYAPRPFMEGIEPQGLVLGVCDESYFE